MLVTDKDIQKNVKEAIKLFSDTNKYTQSYIVQQKRKIQGKFVKISETSEKSFTVLNSHSLQKITEYKKNFIQAYQDLGIEITNLKETQQKINVVSSFFQSVFHSYSWAKIFLETPVDKSRIANEAYINFIYNHVLKKALRNNQETRHLTFLNFSPYIHDQDGKGLKRMNYSCLYQNPYKIKIDLKGGGYFTRCEAEFLLTHKKTNLKNKKALYTKAEVSNDVNDTKETSKQLTPQDYVSYRLRFVTSLTDHKSIKNKLADKETDQAFQNLLSLGPILINVTNMTNAALDGYQLPSDLESKITKIRNSFVYDLSKYDFPELIQSARYMYLENCKNFFSHSTNQLLKDYYQKEFPNIKIKKFEVKIQPSISINTENNPFKSEPQLFYNINEIDISKTTYSYYVSESSSNNQKNVIFEVSYPLNNQNITLFHMRFSSKEVHSPNYRQSFINAYQKMTLNTFSVLKELDNSGFKEKIFGFNNIRQKLGLALIDY